LSLFRSPPEYYGLTEKSTKAYETFEVPKFKPIFCYFFAVDGLTKLMI